MIGLSLLIFSVLLAAPPTTSSLSVRTAATTTPAIRTVSTTKAPIAKTPIASTPGRQYTSTIKAPLRTAQVPPKPQLPPQPEPLRAPPLPLDAAPHTADPYAAPHLAPPHGLVPPPPPVGADPGYGGPVLADPMGMPPVPNFGPAPGPGPGEYVDPGVAGNCPNCLGCPCGDDDDGCCLCRKIPHPCNMFPHYAYYPQYHGHYYFRPYNYTTVFQQQQWAAAAGIDPRNPYSNKIFCMAMAGFEQNYRPENAPIGSALPIGNGLPQLEELLAPKTTR